MFNEPELQIINTSHSRREENIKRTVAQNSSKGTKMGTNNNDSMQFMLGHGNYIGLR